MSQPARISFYLKEFFFILAAIFTGVSVQMAWFTSGWNPALQTLAEAVAGESWRSQQMPLRLWVTPLVLVGFFYLMRAGFRKLVIKNKKYLTSVEDYLKYDTYTYLVFLLSGLAAFGVFLEGTVLFICFMAAQLFLLYRLCPNSEHAQTPDKELLGLFFISGFAALIYQVIWQRVLFQSFGVNIESVTVIVSIFMFGLGVGSLVGGYLSKKFAQHQMLIFAICEVAIGVFGLFSLYLIDYITEKTLHRSPVEIALATYGLLFIPTTLMGATLPIMVSHLHKTLKSVGESVSFLYFINTLGSAAASFVTVHLFFYYFNLNISLIIAAVFNFAVVYFVWKKFNLTVPENLDTSVGKSAEEVTSGQRALHIPILVLSAAIGYISLSQEIIWMRLIGYATGAGATVFGNLLCFFLLGIALGSLWAVKICRKYEKQLLSVIALVLAVSAVAYYLMLPFLGFLSSALGDSVIPFMYLAVAFAALSLGVIFPLLTHYAIQKQSEVGASVSFVYFANVIGSTAGPIVTGFILLDLLSLSENVRLLSALTLLAALFVFLFSVTEARRRMLAVFLVAGLVAIELFVHTPLYAHLYEKLYYKQSFSAAAPFKKTIETRSGVINLAAGEAGADIIIGGGKYDGHFNTDLVRDTNSIARAYMLAALHPNPKNVLEIGLSGGAWGTVISKYPKVSSLDIVEINSGYIELVRNHSPYAELLSNPKVQIHLDDARRWLLRNPEKKFDVIMMNTTYHWRSQISNLVSKEFLEICKAHLKPGGVLYYNTTGSADIPFTAAQVFQYVTRFRSFVAASDTAFSLSEAEIKNNLILYAQSRDLVQDSSIIDFQQAVEVLAKSDLADKRDEIMKTSSFTNLITDNNLASEFKTGRKVFVWERNWLQLMPR